MAATMKRATVTIDDVEISTIETHYVVSRAASPHGRRIGDSMRARAFFYADISDTARNEPDKVIQLWKMATETDDPLHKVEIAFFAEDATKRIQTVKFQGWISTFETYNPALGGNGLSGLEQYGNVLHCELTVVLDDKNISKHQVTK